MDNLKFKANPNPFIAFLNLVRSTGIHPLRQKFRISPILILGFIVTGLIVIIPFISIIFSRDFSLLSKLILLFVLPAFAILVLLLWFIVFLRVKKSSIFNVRAIHFSLVSGFELEYKDGTRKFIEYSNVVDITLKSNIDKSYIFLFGYIFYPKSAEYNLTAHYLLIVKEGESQKEIPIPLDISRVSEAVNLIKSSSNLKDSAINVEGTRMVSFANKSLSFKNIIIASLIIFFILGIIIGIPTYFDWKSKNKLSELGRAGETSMENQLIGTADWKTYKDKQYGYEIKYPQNSEVKIESQPYWWCQGTEEYTCLKLVRILPDGINIAVFDNPDNFSITGWLTKYMPSFLSKQCETKEIRIDKTYGINALCVNGARAIDNFAAKENYLFMIGTSVGPDSKETEEILNQVVSNFNFISTEEENANWQTYRNKDYNYEVKYPKNFTFESNSSGVLFLSPRDALSRQVQDPHFHTFSLFIQPLETYIGGVKWRNTLEQAVKERFGLEELKEQEPNEDPRKGDVDWIRKIFVGDNIEAYFIREWIQAFDQCHYLIKKEDVLIDMSRDGRNGCLDNAQFNKMLSTFRFLE